MADAVLCVAHHEGFGFPALEAFTCGTPVVSSMAGAMRDTLGNAAMAANPDIAQSITDALVAIASDSALRDRLRCEGLKRAAEFRWEHSAIDLRQVYITACQNHQCRAPIAADR
jgi:glycosyltransferase involved in cell wall biosynthesis